MPLEHGKIMQVQGKTQICCYLLQAQPLALQKLAAFLHEAHFQDKKRDRPVVVIGPKSADARCLVVGFAGNPRSGTVRHYVPLSAVSAMLTAVGPMRMHRLCPGCCTSSTDNWTVTPNTSGSA